MGNKKKYGYKKKRKFVANQFAKTPKRSRISEDRTDVGESSTSSDQTSADQTSASASARKISTATPVSPHVDPSKDTKEKALGFRFVDMSILSGIFELLPCKECKECNLELLEDSGKRKGCASYLHLVCSTCNWKKEFYTSSQVNRFFEVNRRMVYSMRSVGCGPAAAKRFCGLMNMPPPPRPTPYSSHNREILKATKTVCMETMNEAAKEIHHLKKKPDDEIIDCAISCDGTWQRRGFSSLNGCVAVISMDNGKVLDVEALSKVCKKCKEYEKMADTPETSAIKADHKSKCKANYQGSAPSMEPEGALRMFNQSVECNKLRYTEFFGDGDSKSYSTVKDVYEEDNITVVKKECVGHVQKRLGTALRKLKKEKKGLGGKGRLTDAMIDKLQNYYGIAIRSNSGDLAGMKKAIHATLFHCASSEERKLHHHCPEGEDSWCGFMRDKATGKKEYKHGPGLPLPIIAELKPVFLRLSDDSLLSKCLDGKTQNQNESLNAMIWERLPKQVFVGSDVLRLGVYDAVAHFNIGANAAVQVLSSMGIIPGEFCTHACTSTDRLRIKKANYKADEKNKKQRKIIRTNRKKRETKINQKKE